MLKVNIIGGSGFIGSRLVSRMINIARFHISIVDKSPSKIFPSLVDLADVRSLDDLRSSIHQSSVIINLAAEHRDDVQPISLYEEVNVGGAHNICTVAREKKVSKIIFTSTVAVYGFAPIGTDENGLIAPFNEYGLSKFRAEEIFRAWQAELPDERTLVIIRPTVVFGERNRGNVYNLFSRLATGKFIMVGDGKNKKSIAYVENLVAFIEHSISFRPGFYLYNFVDKPDFTMNELVGFVKQNLGKNGKVRFRLPFVLGYMIGKVFDIVAQITGKKMSVSSIRVKKFCCNSVYNTAISTSGFVSPVPIKEALRQTLHYEFMQENNNDITFYTE